MLQEFKGAIILCSIISLCASQKPSSQRFEREPEDQTAVYGESVVLACRVINKSGQVHCPKDDFGLGTDRELSEFERYSMIGTDDEGINSLFIHPFVQIVFQCAISRENVVAQFLILGHLCPTTKFCSHAPFCKKRRGRRLCHYASSF